MSSIYSFTNRQNDIYMSGYNADIYDLNPYSANGDLEEYHLWSAGHFDAWGRT